MILLIGGIKGGSGKTTVATNLAVMRSSRGKDVLLVDADDQKSASDFTLLRNEQKEEGAGYTCIKITGPALRTEVDRLKGKYDDIIIDTGGRDTASQRASITVADTMLVPFVPRSFDIWTMEQIEALIEEMRPANAKLKAYTFVNKTDPQGIDNDEAAQALRKGEGLIFVNAPLGNRKAFGNAAAQGCGVIELRPKDTKAIDEMNALYQVVFDM